jgi:predicted nucleic acid-binding protein
VTRARPALDSNILVYAALEPDSEKGKRASAIIRLAAPTGIIATQALLEFVAVVRRRAPDLVGKAIEQAEAWSAVFETVATTTLVAVEAHKLITAHRLQVWDAVILAAAKSAGAMFFLSEDLQDGATIDGVKIANPLARPVEEIMAMLGEGSPRSS